MCISSILCELSTYSIFQNIFQIVVFRLKIDAEVEDEKKADLKYGRSRGRSKKRIPKLGSPKSPNKRKPLKKDF